MSCRTCEKFRVCNTLDKARDMACIEYKQYKNKTSEVSSCVESHSNKHVSKGNTCIPKVSRSV